MQELFYFDIETASNYPNWETFLSEDERGAKLFESKYQKMNWEEKYSTIEEAYKEQGGIISTYGRIVCISFGYIDSDGKPQIRSFFGEDEQDIVNSFNELLKKIEKKAFSLSGYRVLYFDIPYILHKLHKWGIKPADIINPYGKKPWEMRVVDMSDDWKGKFAWAWSFDEMCYELGVESPKVNINGSDVNEYYWNGRLEEIKEYCERDVLASIEVSKLIY
jgi:3'-5' exonuclease